jgi:uncharacterized membrane protein YfcA
MRLATLAYAIYLLIGALGVLVVGILVASYGRGWIYLGAGILLLLCAAVFYWGVSRSPGSIKHSKHGSLANQERDGNPVRTLQWWALIIIGVGTGIALAMFGVGAIAYFSNTGFPFLPAVIFGFACQLSAAGLLLFLVEVLARRSDQRRQ